MKVAVRVIGVIVCLILIAAFLLEPVGSQKAVAFRGLEKPVVDTQAEEVVSASMMAAPEWTKATREWTEAEMAAAKPYPMPESPVQPDAFAPQGGLPDVQAAAPVKTFPAGLPEGEVGYVNDLSGLSALTSGGALAPTGYTYPPPFTRYTYYGQYHKEYPYKTIGKLYFVQYGTAYVCSASSIGNYAIWTAGHCVHAGDGLSSGWSYYTMFLPGYDNGKTRLQRWFGVDLWTLGGWYNNSDLRYDMGGIVLAKNKRKSISQKVGWLGFAYTPDANGYYAQYHWFGIGYPAASPFDGQKQVVCASSYAYSDTSFGSPYPVGVGCDQTGGTSGGPWILAFGTGYYLNGNMSYRYVQPYHPQEIFSPYFGDGAYNLWYALVTDTP